MDQGDFGKSYLIALGVESSTPFVFFLTYGVACAGLVLWDSKRFIQYFVIRLGIYSGLAVSLYYGLIVLPLMVMVGLTGLFLLLPFVYLSPAFLIRRLEKSREWRRRFRRFFLPYGLFLILLWVVAVTPNGLPENEVTTFLVVFLWVNLGVCAPYWFVQIFLTLLNEVSTTPLEGRNTNLAKGVGGLWVVSLLMAWLYSWDKALKLYNALPLPPPPVNDCFVATAAAKGHPCFVGSHIATNSAGKAVPITQQLITLKTFENLLEARRPRAHRALRSIYNRIGPPLAACIVHPILADFAYLLLKPAEWFAKGFVSVAGNRLTVSQRLTCRELSAKDPGK